MGIGDTVIKTKIKRIEELNDKYLILNEKEMKFLRKCLKSRKQDVRWTAAEILVGWYTPENAVLLPRYVRKGRTAGRKDFKKLYTVKIFDAESQTV